MAVRQSSFAGGEIAPGLYGRSDLERYLSSCRRLRNFIVTPQGGALNRPGTEHLGTVKTQGLATRLIPYVYSETESFVLEFGNQYIRFWRDGAQVMSGLVPYEITSVDFPATARLPYIKTLQIGRALYFTEGTHGWTALQWGGATNIDWTYWSPVDQDLVGVTPQWATSNNPYLYESDSGALPVDGDGLHPGRPWRWALTQVLQDSVTGAIFESTAFEITQSRETDADAPSALPSVIPVYIDKPIIVRWTSVSGMPVGFNGYFIKAIRVYRGRGRILGFVGEVLESESPQFVDVGDEPDYTIPPPQGLDPFEVLDDDGSVLRTEEPVSLGMFEQRLVVGGTNERPGRLWFSKTGVFSNFDRYLLPQADSPVQMELASMQREQIRSLVGLDSLFVLTSGGVWSLDDIGGDKAPVALKHTEEGSSWVSPLVASDALLYVRSKGVGVNELQYSNERAKFGVVDLSAFAPHLLDGYTITEWAYAHDPYRIIWAVRSDGALLALTYHRPHQVVAWTLCTTTTGDAFESVCVVPEGSEDAVYFVVRRTVNGATVRYVERLASRPGGDLFLDAAVEVTESGAVTEIDGLGHLEGESVKAVLNGFVFGPYTVTDGAITLNQEITDPAGWVGLPYEPELETLDVVNLREDVRGRQKMVRTVTLDVVASRGMYVGETADRLSEWKQRAVADGFGPVPEFTGQVKINISATWNTGGRIVVRQVDPLPLAIHGISREVAFGGE